MISETSKNKGIINVNDYNTAAIHATYLPGLPRELQVKV